MLNRPAPEAATAAALASLAGVEGKGKRLFDIDGDGLSAAERRQTWKAEAKWWTPAPEAMMTR
jgi:hypothetical protein